MHHPSPHIFSKTLNELQDWCLEHNMPKYRAQQLARWVYEKNICDPDSMSDFSQADRQTLANAMAFISSRQITHQLATDGTQKLLLQWEDQLQIAQLNDSLTVLDPSRQTECVMIPTENRKTACISSQVGCPVGCRFCASGMNGLDGNLSSGRIVEQVWQLSQLPGVDRITNVVFMGMGEPLANLQNVIPAVRTLADQTSAGFGISARKITISTVGIPKAINRLADELDLPVTLALSLHAPNDEIRKKLIPWAEYTSIAELLDSCKRWFNKTGREITLEYVLLGKINDQPAHAEQLAKVARTIRANINLIRYNEVNGIEYQRPKSDAVHRFQQILQSKGVNTHIRASRGRDIAAACGQLRHEQAQKDSKPKADCSKA